MSEHHDQGPEIADPKGYQAMLLGHLGDDDPAQVQAGTPAALRALFDEAGSDLRARPEPGEWSVPERGPESLDLSFRLIAGHDRLHLEQARNALAAVRG